MFASSMARQKTLAESRADRTTSEMAAIVEYSCDAIYGTDTQGTITSWNRAAEGLYGYTAEEAVGLHVTRLVPPERGDELERKPRNAQRGELVTSYRSEAHAQERHSLPGAPLRLAPAKRPLPDRRGIGHRARSFGREDFRRGIRRSEKLATAGRLAASMAHEINNPLEAVINLLYLARHDSRNALEYLTQAEQEVGRVARLAQQTLGFVRDTSVPRFHGSRRNHGRDSAPLFPQARKPPYWRNPSLSQLLPRRRLFRRTASAIGESSRERGRCDGGRRQLAKWASPPRATGPMAARESASP